MFLGRYKHPCYMLCLLCTVGYKEKCLVGSGIRIDLLKVVDNGMMPHEGASLVNILFISRYLANQKA